MTAAENEHEALCGELSSRMSAVGVKRARLGMNLKTFNSSALLIAANDCHSNAFGLNLSSMLLDKQAEMRARG